MKNLFTLILSTLMVVSLTNAQTFWNEDFDTEDNFFNWENEDQSGNGALWTWCEGTAVGPNELCPSVWDGGTNLQVPFAATTSENGFVTMDSDEVGSLPSNHESTITTEGIDCSGKTNVHVEFQSHIGVFEVDADTGAVFSVSNDGGSNWMHYAPHPFLKATAPDPACVDTCRWSSNPLVVDFDISAVADGQGDVLLRWYWSGNFEYHWSLDDVRLYEDSPVGIAQVGDESIGIQIVPMPVASEMNIQLNFDQAFEQAEIQISNLVGKVIESRKIESLSLDQELTFDMSQNASGIYFVSVVADGRVNTKKFILTN